MVSEERSAGSSPGAGRGPDWARESPLSPVSRDFLDTLPAGILVHREGEVLYANREAARVVGLDGAAELVGRDIYEFLDPGQRDRARRRARRVVEEGERPGPVEYRVVTADGSEAWVHVRGRPVEHEGEPASQVLIRDVTEQRRARQALEESEQRYRTLFEENVAGVFRSTPEGRILECNEAFAEMLGYGSPDELEGTSAASLFASPEEREAYLETLREEGAIHNHELHLERRDGSDLWVLENARLERSPGGDPVIYGTLVDVSEQRRLRERLEELAYHDPLTGLPNRRLLAEHAGQVISSAGRRGDRVGILYLDLARFKRVNDTLGHSAGDRVLVQAAQRLRRTLRDGDTAARVGGDEFAVLLPDVEAPQAAVRVARRLRDRLDRPFRLSGRDFRVTPQVGAAVFPEHGGDFQELFSAADRAMYRAKREPGTGIAVADPGTEAPEPDAMAEEEHLRRALEAGRLVPHYQPILSAEDLDRVGAEALARWIHPERGVLPAGDFVHLAERTGFVRRLDLRMLERAVRQAAEWCTGGRLRWVSVNVSPATFEPDGLAGQVRERLAEEGVEPGRLRLEVTEQVSVRKPREAARTLAQLHDLGVKVAIDDFGTGHSALMYLHRFPADVLKMDRLFVDRLGRSEREERLVEGVLGLGRNLRMEVAAEGIEREEQAEWLRERGCDLLQGRYFAPAMAAERFTRTWGGVRS